MGSHSCRWARWTLLLDGDISSGFDQERAAGATQRLRFLRLFCFPPHCHHYRHDNFPEAIDTSVQRESLSHTYTRTYWTPRLKPYPISFSLSLSLCVCVCVCIYICVKMAMSFVSCYTILYCWFYTSTCTRMRVDTLSSLSFISSLCILYGNQFSPRGPCAERRRRRPPPPRPRRDHRHGSQ